MQKQVEEFMANLLSAGMKQEQVSEKGYEFALALIDGQAQAGTPVSATAMFRASEHVKNALPGAYRLYELRTQMR